MAEGHSPTQGGGSGIRPAAPATQGEASGEVLNNSRPPCTEPSSIDLSPLDTAGGSCGRWVTSNELILFGLLATRFVAQ